MGPLRLRFSNRSSYDPSPGVRPVKGSGSRLEVGDRDVLLPAQPLGDQRAMAGLGGALDAEQHRMPTADEGDERREVGRVEDLFGVEAAIDGRQLRPRAFALSPPGILAVLR